MTAIFCRRQAQGAGSRQAGEQEGARGGRAGNGRLEERLLWFVGAAPGGLTAGGETAGRVGPRRQPLFCWHTLRRCAQAPSGSLPEPRQQRSAGGGLAGGLAAAGRWLVRLAAAAAGQQGLAGPPAAASHQRAAQEQALPLQGSQPRGLHEMSIRSVGVQPQNGLPQGRRASRSLPAERNSPSLRVPGPARACRLVQGLGRERSLWYAAGAGLWPPATHNRQW